MVHGGDMVELVVTGANFDEAAAAAHEDADARGATFIEPFDARDTVIGQGTVAAEIISQLSSQGGSLDTGIVPIGGGAVLSGLISNLAAVAPRTSLVGN